VKRALVFLFTLGCARATTTVTFGPLAPAPVAAMGSDEDAVREATFRWMFRHNSSSTKDRAKVCCLEFENKSDPSPSFMARFVREPRVMRASSGCTADTFHGVRDRTTHVHGLVFRIDGVSFDDADHATVWGGYFEGALSAAGDEYTLERRNGAWVVTKDEERWIS
jgi:hypothetical protein